MPDTHPPRRTSVAAEIVGNTIVLRRSFAAPRREVFAAWTQPEHVSLWWDPSGAQLKACNIDLRTGGSFSFVPSGESAHAFTGTYREIAPPARLVFEAMGAIGSVLLDEAGDGTMMTVKIECPSAQHLDHFLSLGVDVGTARTLDNLVTHTLAMAAGN